MFAKVRSVALKGISTMGVDIEVGIMSRGLPCFDIVGLPDKSVAESRMRVRAAFASLKLNFPNKKVTVNMAPADLHKGGSLYDLPIAFGILACTLGISVPDEVLFFGELSLDGGLRHTKGAFLLALYAAENGCTSVFVPHDCVAEAACVPGIAVYGLGNLGELVDHYKGVSKLNPAQVSHSKISKVPDKNLPDMRDIYGQTQAKRAIEISAAGGHNLLMMGSPGVGKTMLARSLVGILPPLSEQESFEVTKIYSCVGRIPPGTGLITQRPFRSPHHTTSYTGLLGGGSYPLPGEISYAHRGVLFLDEFTQYTQAILEALRQPLENGEITISRSRGSTTFPSKFSLIAACNPCPCGFLGHPTLSCKCTPRGIQKYKRKLSGPILDRIDLHVSLTTVDISQHSIFSSVKNVESSDEVGARILGARDIQNKRFRNISIITNAEMTNKQIRKFCSMERRARAVLDNTTSKYGLSARAYFKLIKVAQTIADLARCDSIKPNHVLEAIHFRTGS